MNKKRKNTEFSANVLANRKSTNNHPKYIENKTLTKYFAPIKKSENNKSSKSRSRSTSKDKTVDFNLLRSNIPLIKNPSKQALIGSSFKENKEIQDYKNKILFNENFIETLKKYLNPFIYSLTNSLLTKHLKNNFFDENFCEAFLEDNFQNILIKYLLQTCDDFLYIPIEFINSNEEDLSNKKKKLKLFENLKELKNLTLQYNPANSKEVLLFNLLF